MESTAPTLSAPQSTEQQSTQPPIAAATASVSSSVLTTETTTSTVSSPNLNPSKPSTSQTRPSFNTRPWQQPTYPHFSLPSPPLITSPSASTSSITTPPPSIGGMPGAPAVRSITSTPPPASFSSITSPSYAQQSQIRQPVQGIQSTGMTGALGATSSVRPGGVVSAHQLRASQVSPRPQTSLSSPSPSSQNIQGHSMLGVSSLGSPSNSQSLQPQNQPWLSSGTQGKPPLPSPPVRPPASLQSFQQRPYMSQQHPQSIAKHVISSSQQVPQLSASGQLKEHHGQQFPSPRIQLSLSHQQQITRGPALGSLRPPLGTSFSGDVLPGSQLKAGTTEIEESSNRIVSKRSIRDLVNQIDPSEKLDADVEDILVDIAEDFVESITTFSCSLAKHRKSTTLESKDILLHLERNYNLTLPGFGGDEIRTYKKPFVSDVHRERLSAIKKSNGASEPLSKHSGVQSGANAKG